MDAIAAKIAQVPGIVGVMLGGSRARGTHRPDSDWDLGVYYRGAPDLAALEALAAEVTGGPVEVYGPGSWGPWVNGGAWLELPDGRQVDWILRDVDRVRQVWYECCAGRFEIGVQAGHPLGFWSPPIRARRRWAGCSPTPRANWPGSGRRPRTIPSPYARH